MKKKIEQTQDVKQTISNNLERIRKNFEKVNDVKQLNEALKEIIKFGERAVTEYVPLGSAEILSFLETSVIEAYDDASKVVEGLSGKDREIFKKFIDSMKTSWQGSVSLSKEEVSDKLREKATELHRSGNYKEALTCLTEALELAPQDSRNWFERGNVFSDMSDYTAAIRDYEVAVKFDPLDSNALCNLGWSMASVNKFNESLEYFDRALRLDPGQAESLIGKAESLFRLERFQEAQEMANQAIDLYPDNVEANLTMGRILHDGFYNSNKARGYTQKALDLDKDNMIAKANLAELLLGCKEYKLSGSYAEQVIQSATYEGFGYPMRLVSFCAQSFLREPEAAKTGYDLVEYYNTVHDRIPIVWKFRGLRRIVEKKSAISSDVRTIILKFIDLVEEPSLYRKKRLLETLPNEIKSVDFSAQPRSAQAKIENAPAPTLERSITVENTSAPSRTQTGYYNWAIFLSPKKALDQVDHVRYTLHRTFPNYLREVRNRSTGFRLQSKGWGEFKVKVEIFPVNSDNPIVKYHWLKLRSTVSPGYLQL